MRNKGNILLTFILLLALASLILSFLFSIYGKIRKAGIDLEYTKALYIAEAGMNKAIWYLVTPAGQGGRGGSYRTGGMVESYSDGKYTLSILDGEGPNDIVITSTGEVKETKRAVQVTIRVSEYPAAFDYAIFNNGGLQLKGAVSISGDIFTNGNAVIENPAVVSGEVFTSPGSSVSGNGTYTVGGVLDPPPTMPFLNTTYYDNELNIAKSQALGDITYDNYDLGGQTIYVNGNVTLNGEITGSGKIIATGNITLNGNTISGNTSLVAGNDIIINGTAIVQNDSLIYSANQTTISGNARIDGSIMASKAVISGTPTIIGLVYSWEVGIDVKGTVNLYGSLVNPASEIYTGNISVVYNKDYLPQTVPYGLTGGGFRIVPGSWKEL